VIRVLIDLKGNRMNLYGIMDLTLGEYVQQLLLVKTDEGVKRELVTRVMGTDSMMARYPAQFNVMNLGMFDLETGLLVPERIPLLVVNLGALFIPEEVPNAPREGCAGRCGACF